MNSEILWKASKKDPCVLANYGAATGCWSWTCSEGNKKNKQRED